MIALSTIAIAMMMSSSASAQFIDDGPTRDDFTNNGVFDQEGYIAALLSFQAAPKLTIDAPITLSIRECPSGRSLSAEFLGYPASKVSVTSVGDPTIIVITPPAGIDVGYNVIRVTCGTSQPPRLMVESARLTIGDEPARLTVGDGASTIIRDIIVNLQPSGPGVGNTLSVKVLSTPAGGGSLPVSGSDTRTILGMAAAALLLGGAVTFGAQRRFSSAN